MSEQQTERAPWDATRAARFDLPYGLLLLAETARAVAADLRLATSGEGGTAEPSTERLRIQPVSATSDEKLPPGRRASTRRFRCQTVTCFATARGEPTGPLRTGIHHGEADLGMGIYLTANRAARRRCPARRGVRPWRFEPLREELCLPGHGS